MVQFRRVGFKCSLRNRPSSGRSEIACLSTLYCVEQTRKKNDPHTVYARFQEVVSPESRKWRPVSHGHSAGLVLLLSWQYSTSSSPRVITACRTVMAQIWFVPVLCFLNNRVFTLIIPINTTLTVEDETANLTSRTIGSTRTYSQSREARNKSDLVLKKKKTVESSFHGCILACSKLKSDYNLPTDL